MTTETTTNEAPSSMNSIPEEPSAAAPVSSLAVPSASTDVPPRSPPRTRYDLQVVSKEDDRASEIKLLSFKRPHMRAFHCSWLAFFCGFFLWFSASPLLPQIQTSLNLSNSDIWISTICGDICTLLIRMVLGPICDVYGARWPMGIVLSLGAIPAALLGTAHTLGGLCVLRFLIGALGATFVMSQSWVSRMISSSIIGTANAVVAGWGNSGAFAAQLIMGAFLFPVFRDALNDSDLAWRVIFVFPAVIAILVAVLVIKISDDAPQGNYKEMKLNGTMDARHVQLSPFQSGKSSINAWLLAIQYFASFGVEITCNNALNLYFVQQFGRSTVEAALISSAFGAMNLFARACGGILSDKLFQVFQMRGRLALVSACLVLQGAGTIGFAYCDTLGASIGAMVVFSIFVQASEGAIFGIVPYVNTPITGAIAGIVGSGGNMGGVIFGVVFALSSYKTGFLVMGSVALASSVLSAFVHIPGHLGLFSESKDSLTWINRQREREEVANDV